MCRHRCNRHGPSCRAFIAGAVCCTAASGPVVVQGDGEAPAVRTPLDECQACKAATTPAVPQTQDAGGSSAAPHAPPPAQSARSVGAQEAATKANGGGPKPLSHLEGGASTSAAEPGSEDMHPWERLDVARVHGLYVLHYCKV